MDTTVIVTSVITVLCSVLASSGLWTFFLSNRTKHDAQSKMLLGLGHDRIMYLGQQYIKRGYITQDEFENLDTYLYEPYKELGGNGTAELIMDKVRHLEIR